MKYARCHYRYLPTPLLHDANKTDWMISAVCFFVVSEWLDAICGIVMGCVVTHFHDTFSTYMFIYQISCKSPACHVLANFYSFINEPTYLSYVHQIKEAYIEPTKFYMHISGSRSYYRFQIK